MRQDRVGKRQNAAISFGGDYQRVGSLQDQSLPPCLRTGDGKIVPVGVDLIQGESSQARELHLMRSQHDPVWKKGVPIWLPVQDIERVRVRHQGQVRRLFAQVFQQAEQEGLRALGLAQARTHQNSIFPHRREKACV